MKIKLMYGPASGQVINIDPAKSSHFMPVIPKVQFFTPTPEIPVPEEKVRTVEYGPRPLSGNIWYPIDQREWYTGSQWDGFRPDGAPSPGDAR